MSSTIRIASVVVPLTLAFAGACADSAEDVPAPAATSEAPAATEAAAPAQDTPEGKIEDAMSAAPAEIAQAATIQDWPAAEGEAPTVLREGTNGWTCLPTMPEVAARGETAPMCVDAAFMEWAHAYMTRGTPAISHVGLAYMLAGDAGASNVDPFATERTADNEWVQEGPHVMMVVPDPAQLEGIPTEPSSGGPYVMWRGTPYAHVMMPVTLPR